MDTRQQSFIDGAAASLSAARIPCTGIDVGCCLNENSIYRSGFLAMAAATIADRFTAS
jgi:hypothetical protein